MTLLSLLLKKCQRGCHRSFIAWILYYSQWVCLSLSIIAGFPEFRMMWFISRQCFVFSQLWHHDLKPDPVIFTRWSITHNLIVNPVFSKPLGLDCSSNGEWASTPRLLLMWAESLGRGHTFPSDQVCVFVFQVFLFLKATKSASLVFKNCFQRGFFTTHPPPNPNKNLILNFKTKS